MNKDIEYYLSAFEKMKRAIMRGVKAPHKPLLLLAIFVAEGLAMDIPHSYPFKCSIENPYYHLQHEPFWRSVKNEKGKERKFYSSLKSLRDGFAYAEIDQELYDLMVNRESAVILECKFRELV